MPLPAWFRGPSRRRSGCEVTPLGQERQFKPFVYLNGRVTGPHKGKPRLSTGTSLRGFTSGLAVHIGVLTGSIVLTAARILLLLTRLLTSALLLLAGLLTRVLVLLARFLGRVVHSGMSVFERGRSQPNVRALVARERRFRRDDCAAKPCWHCDQGTGAEN